MSAKTTTEREQRIMVLLGALRKGRAELDQLEADGDEEQAGRVRRGLYTHLIEALAHWDYRSADPADDLLAIRTLAGVVLGDEFWPPR